MPVDVPDDVFGQIMHESMNIHDGLMGELGADANHIHQLTRSFGAKKYDEIEPIQAAAAEMVLQFNPPRTA